MERSSKKVMIVGSKGLVGNRLTKIIQEETDWEVLELTRDQLSDSTGSISLVNFQEKEKRELLEGERWKADCVINAAAMTNVDKCEVEKEQAWRDNVMLVERLTEICRKNESRLVQLSTDHVFDGVKGPYQTYSKPNPINYYGRTKLAAENTCRNLGVEGCIIRTMWVYGGDTKETFDRWVLNGLESRKSYSIAEDEWGNPTHVDDLCYGILLVVEKSMEGVIHIAGEERVNRWDWVEMIAEYYDLKVDTFKKVKSEELKRAAKRPLNSGLWNSLKLLRGGVGMLSIKEGIEFESINRKRMQEERIAR